MSTSAFLYSFQENLFKYGGPILIAFGTIGSVLNLMVFTQNTLRKNPCTICFIIFNSMNLIYFYVGFLFVMLTFGYDIDLSKMNIGFCRFRYYIAFVLACWEPSCLIIASIDRTLVTSPNALTRRLSTRRLIVISIIVTCLFWAIFHVHALIYIRILQYGPDYFICFHEPGAYTTFVSYYSLFINGLFLPVLMLIFGCWTVKNIRGISRATQQSGTSNSAVVVVIGRPRILQSKDRQLIRILLVELVSFILFKFPITICYMYQEITRRNEKSVEQQLIEQYILLITSFVYFIENGISFYTNILVSKTFRSELKRVLLNVCRCPQHIA
ncbi:hypothetical protein I4U23_011156 [Adineta vaga]|nr:hypothetical protein I4U23_011156 [Adineta vaga]